MHESSHSAIKRFCVVGKNKKKVLKKITKLEIKIKQTENELNKQSNCCHCILCSDFLFFLLF